MKPTPPPLRHLVQVALVLVFPFLGSAFAADPTPPPPTEAPGGPNAPGSLVLPAVNPTAARVHEFSGDDLGLVLRTLARQANINMVVSPAVQGTLTMRLTDMTARQAIEVICQSNGLFLDELNKVVYVKTQAEKTKEPTESLSFTFSYASAASVLPLLSSQLTSGIAPQFDARTNTIYYREGNSNLAKVKAFLESIDHPTQQVMIEARIVEVNADSQHDPGIKWDGVIGGISSSMGDYAKLTSTQLAAALRELNRDPDAKVRPNVPVFVASNQKTGITITEMHDSASQPKAAIKITRTQPAPQLNFNEQTDQAVFGGFTDKEFGKTLTVTPSVCKEDFKLPIPMPFPNLEVTPAVGKNGFVSLTLQPQGGSKVADVCFVFRNAKETTSAAGTPAFESNLLLKSGETLALHGVFDRPTTGVGLSKDVIFAPTKRQIFIFITATIQPPAQGGAGVPDNVYSIMNGPLPGFNKNRSSINHDYEAKVVAQVENLNKQNSPSLQVLRTFTRNNPEIETSYNAVKAADRFSIGGVGDAGIVAPTEEAMRRLVKAGDAEKLKKLLSEATPAGQLYALLGLKLLKAEGFDEAAKPLLINHEKTPTAAGCEVGEAQVSAIAAEIKEGRYE